MKSWGAYVLAKMLIELDALGQNGSTINFRQGSAEVSPFVLTRPTSLILTKRHYCPTLPPTPEFVPFRERSFYSLPIKPDDVSKEAPARPLSCIITSPNCSLHWTPFDDVTNRNKASCGWWAVSRWHKLMGKSSPRRNVSVKCDIEKKPSRKKNKPALCRRNAVRSHAFSIVGKVRRHLNILRLELPHLGLIIFTIASTAWFIAFTCMNHALQYFRAIYTF